MLLSDGKKVHCGSGIEHELPGWFVFVGNFSVENGFFDGREYFSYGSRRG